MIEFRTVEELMEFRPRCPFCKTEFDWDKKTSFDLEPKVSISIRNNKFKLPAEVDSGLWVFACEKGAHDYNFSFKIILNFHTQSVVKAIPISEKLNFKKTKKLSSEEKVFNPTRYYRISSNFIEGKTQLRLREGFAYIMDENVPLITALTPKSLVKKIDVMVMMK